MNNSKFKVGDIVVFGRSRGEKTKGEVIKVNRKSLKVKTLEARGSGRASGAGRVWRVHPSLCEKVEEKTNVVPLIAPGGESVLLGVMNQSVERHRAIISKCEALAERLEEDDDLALSLQEAHLVIEALGHMASAHELKLESLSDRIAKMKKAVQ